MLVHAKPHHEPVNNLLAVVPMKVKAQPFQYRVRQPVCRLVKLKKICVNDPPINVCLMDEIDECDLKVRVTARQFYHNQCPHQK